MECSAFPEENHDPANKSGEKGRENTLFPAKSGRILCLSKLTKTSLQTERTLFKHHDFLKKAVESKKKG